MSPIAARHRPLNVGDSGPIPAQRTPDARPIAAHFSPDNARPWRSFQVVGRDSALGRPQSAHNPLPAKTTFALALTSCVAMHAMYAHDTHLTLVVNIRALDHTEQYQRK